MTQQGDISADPENNLGSRRAAEVAALFLRLGMTAFGGPASHIAMMHDEAVRRRRWLTDQEFLDLVGATNLIPGPNSTEMAIHIGFRRAGWLGLMVGGAAFILPAMLIVMGLAWVYAEYGSMPQATWLLYGVKPVVIAIITQALWFLGRKAASSPLTVSVGLAVFVLHLFGVNEILLLFAGGVLAMIGVNMKRLMKPAMKNFLAAPIAGLGMMAASAAAAIPFALPKLFLAFFKIGAILYGSGYVLLAFLRADLVLRFGWLTDQQLLDAVAIGQVTPGPVFTTATFIGFILGGLPGAILATVGIFLPSFIFVAISNPLIPRIRGSAWVKGLLDGANAASLGLMASVTWRLGRASLTDMLTALVALISLALLARAKINSTWLVLGGAAVGLLSSTLR